MRKFAADVDAAIGSDARVVIVRSASEKFFSAGADVKRFLDGDVEANMEMIRTSQAAFRRIAAAEQVFVAHVDGHALGGGLEIALACDVRFAAPGSLQARHAGGHARAAARQRRHAAADAAARRRRGRWTCCSRAARSRPRRRCSWGLVAALFDEAGRARVRRAARRRARRWRSRPSSAASTRAASSRSTTGSRSRRELVERLFRSAGRQRGADGVRREASAGVRGA